MAKETASGFGRLGETPPEQQITEESFVTAKRIVSPCGSRCRLPSSTRPPSRNTSPVRRFFTRPEPVGLPQASTSRMSAFFEMERPPMLRLGGVPLALKMMSMMISMTISSENDMKADYFTVRFFFLTPPFNLILSVFIFALLSEIF